MGVGKHGRASESTEQERTMAMLDSLQDDINRYAPEATASRGAQVLFAGDPTCEFLAGPEAIAVGMSGAFGTEPFAGLIPYEAAEGLVKVFADGYDAPAARELLSKIRRPLTDGHFRMLTICGSSIGVSVVQLDDPEPELINGMPLRATPEEFQEVEIGGEEQMVMTAAGVLKWLLLADPAGFREEHRRRQVERLHERARGAWAAESIRTNPRSFDEVMHATFNVKAIDAGMKAQIEGNPNAAMAAIEKLLDSCVGGLS